ncbi:enoyl-CoA hydratase-related protein [Nannocystis sp. SCPEA4]|uniref:enoyl-CoA hydratase/isomerase family protein n=1 Tax=Nannocystis sp. SCPEA4 TaxID=2996787 RepID=UPI00226E1BE8|nr:enoyl-CoA hydratase-related protein [Nannocystis sp. SCPEA4]MCY1054957.1 enoyl-CoA hydratase-related protein [Nannocystis sp. SCPEA4]
MSEATLPECQTLLLRRDGWRLHVTFNRPEARNAMSFAMVRELGEVFAAIAGDRGVRAVILRGAGGNFCAGGDIKDMAGARGAEPGPDGKDPLATTNRIFGSMLQQIEDAPQAVVAVLEGAVMGGGFGLCCVSDVAVAADDAKLRLPETGLGVPPAQIAPFIVRRVGYSAARRLAVTGGALDAAEALPLGLVHHVTDRAGLDGQVAKVLADIGRCAPEAVATTKRLVLAASGAPHGAALAALLDGAADEFARAARGPEGVEGMLAFIQKRNAAWNDT